MATFRLWVFGCSHLTRDILHGRESLAEALRQSELPAFGGWDVAIDLGDHNGGTDDTATFKDGKEVVRQFGVLRQHPREAIYSVQGNHDREGPGQLPGWWFQKYIDPLGQNRITSGVNNLKRPYPVDGTWERYKFQVGNIVFLMQSDVTRPTTNLRGPMGGDPGGVVTRETFDWWRAQVESYRGGPETVITCHHYLPKNTTVATGDYEGGTIDERGVYKPVYHGPGFDPKGAGRLHYIDDTPDATDFTDHLAEHPGDVAMWLGAHTHAPIGAEVNGRKLRMEISGCHYVNCAALTKHHAGKAAEPRSRVFEFTHGQTRVTVKNWLHERSATRKVGYANYAQINLAKPVELS